PARIAIKAASGPPVMQDSDEGRAAAARAAKLSILACARRPFVFVDGKAVGDGQTEVQARSEVVVLQLAAYALADKAETALARAGSALGHADGLGPINLLERHMLTWDARWEASLVDVEGDEEARRA